MHTVKENVYEEHPALPGVRILVAAAGTEISDQEAERLGLTKQAKKSEPAADKKSEPPANKSKG